MRYGRHLQKISTLEVTSFTMAEVNVIVKPKFFTTERSDVILNELSKSVSERVLPGTYSPQRKEYAFGEPNVEYSESSVETRPWTPTILEIKADVEKEINCEFNFVTMNVFENGKARIGLRKMQETCADVPVVWTFFGVTRNMNFVKKGEKSIQQPLEHGTLLVM